MMRVDKRRGVSVSRSRWGLPSLLDRRFRRRKGRAIDIEVDGGKGEGEGKGQALRAEAASGAGGGVGDVGGVGFDEDGGAFQESSGGAKCENGENEMGFEVREGVKGCASVGRCPVAKSHTLPKQLKVRGADLRILFKFFVVPPSAKDILVLWYFGIFVFLWCC